MLFMQWLNVNGKMVVGTNIKCAGTYNWMSIKASEGHGHQCPCGDWWLEFSNFYDATLSYGDLIANRNSSYYQSGNYTLREIGMIYNKSGEPEYSNRIYATMKEMYDSIGISI